MSTVAYWTTTDFLDIIKLDPRYLPMLPLLFDPPLQRDSGTAGTSATNTPDASLNLEDLYPKVSVQRKYFLSRKFV
jgi:hypothetical protein